MGTIHSFVPEIAAEFIDPVEPADDQSFQVQFIGDSQVERNIQCIMMGHKGPGCGTTGDTLQYRGIYFQGTLVIQEFADGVDHFGTARKCFFYGRVDDQVGITLTVFEFRICNGVEGLSVGFFYNGQWAE